MTVQITGYSATELKNNHPEGFTKAFEKWKNSQDEIFWQSEIRESIQGLFNATNGLVKLIDYSIGAYSYSNIKVEFSDDEDELCNLTGKKAINFVKEYILGDKKAKIKKAKWGYTITDSKGENLSCHFTGYCADDDFLFGLLDSINAGKTLRDAFLSLADVWRKCLENELENQQSEEYFIDHAEANEFIFNQFGKRID